MKNISFIKKIAIPYLLVVTLILVAIAFTTTRYFESFVFESWKNELITETRMAAEQVLISNTLTNPVKLEELIKSLAITTNDRITVILPDGTVIGESEKYPGSLENHLNRPEIQSALAGQTVTVIRTSTTLHTRLLYSASPIIKDSEIIAIIRLAKPVALIDKTMLRYRLIIYLTALGGVILCILLMFIQSGKKVNPLNRISEKVRELSVGNLHRIDIKINHDEIGTIVSSFNSMVDRITLQVAAIQEERSKTNAILSNMKDGVILVDKDGHVTLINPAAQELFKIDQKNAIGGSLAEVVRHFKVLDLWKECKARQSMQTIFLQISMDQDTVQVIASPIQENLPGDVMLLFQDLTLVHKLQTIRQDFVSNVSHELRTPITSLKLLVETLLDGALKSPREAEHFLQQMDVEIDNLTQIVQELLDLSKIESGKVPLNREPIAPYLLLEPAIERMKLQAERTSIEINTNISRNLPNVNVDSKRVQQVIINLLHNAIKFTDPGGKIIVSAIEENESVRFCIEDNGAGIADDDLPRIFERFYKTDRARSSGGTGLGLSIARHIVESHGGRIWVKSRQGQGSKFMFTIPITREKP